ncbi:polyadenylate-binding protein-interacting protein 8-like [Aegilops tauschii subsp. strangulata]|uniref:RRM domain-containing protein n=1 Tax=Aegilops tauschii subsp. strangulata TaxID=200361 RepID=A0A453KLR6_AEGTS|nr:polyadenylate-binding protein-interacting protein 8-like [Aegilops tauschii subsp. strangulata]
MDAVRGSGATPADQTVQTTVSAAAALLNALAREFVPMGAAADVLNPLAKESLPVGAAAALNPLAREFVPWWRVGGRSRRGLSADAPEFVVTQGLYLQDPTVVDYPARGTGVYIGNAVPTRTWRRSRVSNYSQQGRSRYSYRVQRIHDKEFVRRTIYVADIDHSVTEEMLAGLFGICGVVVDCRLSGDPTSGFRFAFIEFQHQENAAIALHLDGIIIGLHPLKVAPSRNAIAPIKHSFLPRSEDEKERSSRTVYCTNIEHMVTAAELKDFFERYFGLVSHVRLLGHNNHATQIAFIEFVEVSGAIIALSSSGIYMRGLAIRVVPSKTPIRTTFNDNRHLDH